MANEIKAVKVRPTGSVNSAHLQYQSRLDGHNVATYLGWGSESVLFIANYYGQLVPQTERCSGVADER